MVNQGPGHWYSFSIFLFHPYYCSFNLRWSHFRFIKRVLFKSWVIIIMFGHFIVNWNCKKELLLFISSQKMIFHSVWFLVMVLIRFWLFQAEKASPTLTLSHSELTHIRSALSRAKLESFPPDLKSDIIKGNLCFLCTKTKFMLFLNRRHQCQLCQQSVCSKCISKVWTYLAHYYKVYFFVQKSISPKLKNQEKICGNSKY